MGKKYRRGGRTGRRSVEVGVSDELSDGKL